MSGLVQKDVGEVIGCQTDVAQVSGGAECSYNDVAVNNVSLGKKLDGLILDGPCWEKYLAAKN